LRDQLFLREISRRTAWLATQLRSTWPSPATKDRSAPAGATPMPRSWPLGLELRQQNLGNSGALWGRSTQPQPEKGENQKTYPHRGHLLLTKSVGQDSMENSGQISAEFKRSDL